MGRDSSVGIATRCGLNRIPVGARFCAPVQTLPGTHPSSYPVGTGSFSGIKRPGRGDGHPSPSSAEVSERIEQYFYFPFFAFTAGWCMIFTVTSPLLHRYFACISVPVLHTRVQLHATCISLVTCRAAHLPFIFCSVSCTQLQSDVPQNKALCRAQSPLRTVFHSVFSSPSAAYLEHCTCGARPWQTSQMELLAGRVWLRCVVQAEGRLSPYKRCNVDFGLGFESGQEQENIHPGSEVHRRMFSAHSSQG
jgi:hypothetical protein